MAINVFEGARRIALLLAGIATIGTVLTVVMHEPYVSVVYTIERPDGLFVKTMEPCPSAAGTHYFTTRTNSGKSVSVTLCLAAMTFENGQQLIPYRIDEAGMIWGAQSYSNEVTTYQRSLERRFRMPESDQAEMEREISRKRLQSAKDAGSYLAIGLLVWAACVTTIGWIFRGFLGIPRGMDRRPE
jgi:hypothetical protein